MRRPLAAVLGVTMLGAAACTGVSEPAAERNEPPGQAATTTTGPADSFTVLATGDVLIHPALTEQAERDAEAGLERDYRPLFGGVRPVVSAADLAICHLEVPLAEDGGEFSGYPSFNAPPELAGALADTGYDSCSTASNHTLDQGADGVRRTLDTLDEAGIRHTGSARTEQEADTPLVLDVNGVTVGQVSFTFGFNGYELPEGKPWMANRLDAEEVIAAAEATRAAGAEVVIASLHWGTEYRHAPTAEQRRLAERLLGEDSIDLILGHHAHVVQPIERIDGEWVAYGLGNHVARHAEPRGVSEEGIAASFRFTREAGGWRVEQAEYVPTLIELGPPIRLVDLGRAGPSERNTEALDRIDEVVLSRGGAEDGLTRPGS
ncbi:poly-gamma-glutamate synthesis protein (capsule biosynthesis protein) [Amycolatopsis cihanbeyliensis]|uniref:Poly-gamma-glutamate synthesis protein (Capsule biosynthesis protein) n=2 Tax=Amycolatopsis cihanbeyliensis TaxID=1128664 RepID=A0A542DR98_AMYCI|nr:poly-gamma-glutamate synthesis protein (capsule biosynthesis protein) [Amycolatopsis cihanbeyliensis]